MNFLKKYWREISIAVLVIGNAAVWSAMWQRRPNDFVNIYSLAVGNGTATLVDTPTHERVLIDGGPDRTILSRLGEVLPFGDRRIDVMIETQASASAVNGLVEVAKLYSIGAFIEPSAPSKLYVQALLEEALKNKNVPIISAQDGTTIDLGGGAVITILSSNKNVPELIYKNQTLLLTGTSTAKTIVRELSD